MQETLRFLPLEKAASAASLASGRQPGLLNLLSTMQRMSKQPLLRDRRFHVCTPMAANTWCEPTMPIVHGYTHTPVGN